MYKKSIFPIVAYSKRIPEQMNPICFYPQILYPDEVFVFIDDRVVLNVMPFRYLISNYGRVWDTAYGKEMPTKFNSPENGYLTTKLAYYISYDKLASKDIYIHRTVLLMFNYFPGCETLQGNHKDGNKSINALYNLEWSTRKENMEHASKMNLVKKGENHPNSKLLNNQVHEICKLLEENILSQAEIARKYNISKSIIYDIKRGSCYKDISCQYNIPKCKETAKLLDENMIHKICEMVQNGYGSTHISKVLGINRGVVTGIMYKNNYPNITSKYNFPHFNSASELKLDDNIVHEICKLLELGISNIEIARKYNISKDTISNIKAKRSYAHIANLYNIPSTRHCDRPLDNDTIHAICKVLSEQTHKNDNEIANIFNIKPYIVRDIRLKIHYKNTSSQYNF